jgi:two-component system OmpR family sensor kinase
MRWLRSFKVRLTLWYAASMAVILAVFSIGTYEIVEHRLENELDRQLRIDFDIIEAQLDANSSGEMQWSVVGAHGDEGFVRLFAWFEVWSEPGELLLRHWPISESSIQNPLPRPQASTLRFYSLAIQDQLPVRIMERPARVQGRGVIVRVLRDESDMHATLRQIVEVFAFAMPLCLLIAAMGGYALARHSLSPVTDMTARARHISSESLAARLPVSNPDDEIGQLAMVFNATLARLERSFSELKRFSADASHELRTPLTALRTVGELALQQPRDACDLQGAVESMLEEAQRLSDLTDAMLMLARLESGPIQGIGGVDLGTLVHEVKEALWVLAEAKHQSIELKAPIEPVQVQGEPVLLRHAVLNILHNAIRYSPEHSRVTMRVVRRDGRAVIEISDEGPGIPASLSEKVFERFYRADEGRSRAAGGQGLGLAIAKSIVDQHGGSIRLTSSENGSTFRIELPASKCLKEPSGTRLLDTNKLR